jgi:Ricin-type beta-trefoil lectin domain-like
MDIPPLGRTYVLRNKATGLALTGQNHDELAHTVMADEPGSPPARNKRWRLEESADRGFYRLVHEETGKVLDSNTERQVYLMTPNDGSYQKWRMEDGGEGYWWLKNLSTGFALDNNLEHDVYTMEPNSGAFQRWAFVPV